VTSSLDERLERAVATLRATSTLPELLRTATEQFVDVADAAACAISRVVGEVLIEVAEHSRDKRLLALGHGYLIPDYPLTKQALEQDTPRTASLLDTDADEKEAAVLRELGFDSLLMLPLSAEEGPWGLVEIYVDGRRFDEGEITRASSVAKVVSAGVDQLPAPGT
jgi:GAF domain-containing protein